MISSKLITAYSATIKPTPLSSQMRLSFIAKNATSACTPKSTASSTLKLPIHERTPLSHLLTTPSSLSPSYHINKVGFLWNPLLLQCWSCLMLRSSRSMGWVRVKQVVKRSRRKLIILVYSERSWQHRNAWRRCMTKMTWRIWTVFLT